MLTFFRKRRVRRQQSEQAIRYLLDHWERQVTPKFLAVGISPDVARTIINDIKENIK